MSSPDTPILLDPVAVARAESLGLNARFIVEGCLAGEHKSPYRGFAIGFAQHRDYIQSETRGIPTERRRSPLHDCHVLADLVTT